MEAGLGAGEPDGISGGGRSRCHVKPDAVGEVRAEVVPGSPNSTASVDVALRGRGYDNAGVLGGPWVSGDHHGRQGGGEQR